MVEILIHKLSLLGDWAYFLIFLAAFLETSAFIGLIVPGESLVVFSGFLASQGVLELEDCLWIISLGAILGDSVGYQIGKRIGKDYFRNHERLFLFKKKHLEKAETYFRQLGGKTVFLGRFVGFSRALVPLVAGMSRMKYWTFLIYNISGGIVWALCFTLLGYYFGRSWRLVEAWAGKIGIFIFLIILVIAVFSYLYKTLIKRQSALYEWAQSKYLSFVSSPRVLRLKVGHPRLTVFIRERLSPQGYLGLHLTIGILLSTLFLWVFSGVTEDILTGDPFVTVDHWVLNHVLYLRHPRITPWMISISWFGGGKALAIGSLLIVSLLLVKKRRDQALSFLAATVGSALLIGILKPLIHRPRPEMATALVQNSSMSFPSGHAMGSIVFYGMIVYFLLREAHSAQYRAFFISAFGFLVFMIGISRIYLQAHYLSDVVAGYMGGLFYLTVCLTGLEVYRRKRSKGVNATT